MTGEQMNVNLKKENRITWTEGITASDLLNSTRMLKKYAKPYRNLLRRNEQGRHLTQMILGLTSDLERKTVEPIATAHGFPRDALQHFVGSSHWDWNSLQDFMCEEISKEIGIENGALVLDGSATQKKATRLLAWHVNGVVDLENRIIA